MLANCAVLLAVYNGMPYLKEQIQTILQQQDVHLTLFVSLDLSTDESESWLHQLAEKEPRLILLPVGERFGGASRNFFRLIRDVDFSPFDFIAFADQDDHWFLDKLARATKILSTSKYEGYSSNFIAFWPDERRQLINKAQSQKTWDYIFQGAGPGCTYVISNKLMKAIKSQILSFWDPLQKVAMHDWFCYAFARAKGYQWFIDKKPSMLYRQHANNQFGVNLGFKAYLKRFEHIKSGWWLQQSLLIAELIGLEQSSFIQSWSKLGRLQMLRLAFNSFQCRRRFREQLIFLGICLGLAIIGGKKHS